MASYITPKKNTALIFYVGLVSQASSHVLQSNPTLAAGDVKVSIDGGALANLATLPAVTPASSKAVKVSLSNSEMNGDNIVVIFSDAAGAEWDDQLINIQTSARQIDDLAFPATTGRSTAIDASGNVTVGGYAAGQVPLQPTTAGRTLDVSSTGEAGLDWANVGSPTTTLNLSGTTVKTATDVETDTQDIQARLPLALTATGLMKADAFRLNGEGPENVSPSQVAVRVWDELLDLHQDAGSTGEALFLAATAAVGTGTGAVLTTFTVNDSLGYPLDGVLVEISTDAEKVNVIASGYTLTNGETQLNVDAGDYFLWKNLAGYDFENPEEITVS